MAKTGKTENDADKSDKSDKSKSGDSLPLTDRLDAARKGALLRSWDATRKGQ